MDYVKFENRIEEMLKIKITNYRMTSNDLHYLMSSVFDEIVAKVTIKTFRQPVIVDKITEEYNLDALYVFVGEDYMTDTLAIEDYNRLDISTLFTEHDDNVFSIKNKELFFQNFKEGDTVYFKRIWVPDIMSLTPQLYKILLPVVLQGCIYHTHDSIPSTPSDQGRVAETNLHYQRYSNEIKGIIETLPQRI